MTILDKVGTFFVPAVMAPGIARHNVGRFKPGAKYTWPDAATPIGPDGDVAKNKEGKPMEMPSLHLVPLDEHAYAWLVHFYGKEAVDLEHPDQFERILAAQRRQNAQAEPPSLEGDGTDLGAKMTGAQAAAARGMAGGDDTTVPPGKIVEPQTPDVSSDAALQKATEEAASGKAKGKSKGGRVADS
jgi:hypothetical protein